MALSVYFRTLLNCKSLSKALNKRYKNKKVDVQKVLKSKGRLKKMVKDGHPISEVADIFILKD